ncbi:uncharacterized protein LOC117781162 [Drosophila innubila]|uniref:uncharacterized protein LOC117781162 n=1 Tax=Drosophila innubila TaxID=198719 RepID=UPI00148E270D|nr:uncharacterized protein LOC117781162 [Drosophila innubila]
MDDSRVIKSTVNKLGDQSPYLQIAVGAGGGFVTGFVLLKACKILAIVVGGSILTIELALQSEIITIEWGGLIRRFEMEEGAETTPPTPWQGPGTRALPFVNDPYRKLKKSLINSARFSVAFLGGFLLGMGFS